MKGVIPAVVESTSIEYHRDGFSYLADTGKRYLVVFPYGLQVIWRRRQRPGRTFSRFYNSPPGTVQPAAMAAI